MSPTDRTRRATDLKSGARRTSKRLHLPASVDLDRLRDALPGSGEVLEARVNAILAMYEYLQEHGSAEKRDLLGVVDADAVDYASPDSVWSNMVNGRDTLRALPGVEPPPSGRMEWRYVDEDSTDSAGGGVYDPTEEF